MCTLYSCGGYLMFDVWRWWNIECFITWTSPWWRDLLSVRLFVSPRTGTPENTDISVPIPEYFLKLAKGLVAYINIDARVGKYSGIRCVGWDVSVELLTIAVPAIKICYNTWNTWEISPACSSTCAPNLNCDNCDIHVGKKWLWQEKIYSVAKSKRISDHLTLSWS